MYQVSKQCNHETVCFLVPFEPEALVASANSVDSVNTCFTAAAAIRCQQDWCGNVPHSAAVDAFSVSILNAFGVSTRCPGTKKLLTIIVIGTFAERN